MLDLGCVNHTLDRSDMPWMHGMIRECAQSVLGVDYLKDEVDVLRERGFNVICADVEIMQLNETFDVVVAADIIEHLANPGKFLQRVREHLRPNGLLLVTTPNPVTLLTFVNGLVSNRRGSNPEHTCWYTTTVLCQLAKRYGYELAEEAYVDDSRLYVRLQRLEPKRTLDPALIVWPARKALLHVNTLMCLVRPRLAATLCLALRRP